MLNSTKKALFYIGTIITISGVFIGLNSLESVGNRAELNQAKHNFGYFKNEEDRTYFPIKNAFNERIFRFSGLDISKNLCFDMDGNPNTIEHFVKLNSDYQVIENFASDSASVSTEYNNLKIMNKDDSTRIHKEYNKIKDYLSVQKYVDVMDL